MAGPDAITVEMGGYPASCRLDLPRVSAEERPFPVVLLCPGLPGPDAQAAAFLSALTQALVNAGLAVATPASGAAGAPGTRLASESIDDAAAVFHGLAVREELDLQRIGVLGHSAGAIVAACLARRTDQIRRLCLLSPVTTGEIAARLADEGEAALAARLGATAVPDGFFQGIESLTPVEDAAAHDRPTLVLHGAADRTVAPEASREYARAIAAAGHACDLVLVALGDHFYTADAPRSACLDALGRFFTATDGTARR
jgi:pimeloyl-ACP methyl ester carboxylesterase